MKKYFWLLFFLPGISGAVEFGILPDRELTPGNVDPLLTKDVICSPEFRTGKYRNVSVEVKKKVFVEYGIPWEHYGEYEVDHLVSLELGGSNDIKNLWPEAYEPSPGAREKDKVENYLRREVCAGRMDLEDARKQIETNWYFVYQELKK